MSILMVTGIEGAQNCAEVLKRELGIEVQVAEGRKAALAAMRRQEVTVLVVDETLAECDPSAAEALWEHAGLAIPLQINFALSGASRLLREIRAALHRREREQLLAKRAAACASTLSSFGKSSTLGIDAILPSPMCSSGSSR